MALNYSYKILRILRNLRDLENCANEKSLRTNERCLIILYFSTFLSINIYVIAKSVKDK